MSTKDAVLAKLKAENVSIASDSWTTIQDALSNTSAPTKCIEVAWKLLHDEATYDPKYDPIDDIYCAGWGECIECGKSLMYSVPPYGRIHCGECYGRNVHLTWGWTK